MDEMTMGAGLTAHDDDSIYIDFDREMHSLGLEVVKASEKVVSRSVDLGDYCYIKKGKVVALVNSVREMLEYLRSEVSDIVQRQKQYFCKDNFYRFVVDLSNKHQKLRSKEDLSGGLLGCEIISISTLPHFPHPQHSP
jgi:uncharacterized protein YuzE